MSGKIFYNFDKASHYAVAEACEKVDPLIFPKQGWTSDWLTPRFTIPSNDGIIPDYIGSDIGGRLCSEKLKNIIEKNKAKYNIIQWLPVDIFNEETGNILRYHHLHFPEPSDCLSEKYTKWDNFGRAIVPWYIFEDIKEKRIFNSARGYERILTIVSSDLLHFIEEAECTGIDCDPANVIYDEDKIEQAAS